MKIIDEFIVRESKWYRRLWRKLFKSKPFTEADLEKHVNKLKEVK